MLKNSLFQIKPRAVLKILYLSLSIIASLLCSAEVLAETDTRLFVPIILSSSGENGSFFTSELTLTNRGATNVTLDYIYTAAFGGGTGLASDLISAGQQRIIPDAIAYLKLLGMPIPDSGDRGGTLSVRTHNLTSLFDFAITVRTTTAEPEGRAGMTYTAVKPSEALYDSAYLFGLRQDASDRSNVAVENIGSPDQGNITLRLTAFSGDSSFQQTLPDIALPPGGWSQISGILHSNGLSLGNGYVRIERVQGTAPYYAYGVINDQVNSDGSFIQPVTRAALHGFWVLPVIVETGPYSSELVVTNLLAHRAQMFFTQVANGIFTTLPVSINIDPGQQVIVPDLVEYLGIPKPFVGTLLVADCTSADSCYGDEPGIWLGVRTFSAAGGTRYGVSYSAVPDGNWSRSDAWLYDLQQDKDNRTNLALVNKGGDSAEFKIEIFDGSSGQKVNSIDGITLESFQWTQIGSILAQSGLHTSQGYAHVTSTSGSNSFVTYAVINNGGQPGTGTGDGAFITSSQSNYQTHLTIEPSPAADGFCRQGVHWILHLSDAPPNNPILLVGGSNGVPDGFGLPNGAKTDNQGNFSATGPVGGGIGTYKLAVEVGGLVSNTVSVQLVGDCI
jgi:hypothetical protein